jgi:hypothetical protein
MERKAAPDARMREMLLAMRASDLKLTPTEQLPHVWAALLDIGMAGGSASIAVVADGTVSMYTSTGGGMIGAGQHASVHAPAARFLKTVEAIHESLEPASSAPVPGAGEAAVIALTYEGMRRGHVELRVMSPKDPLARAWVAGQDVITALRELQESMEKKTGG